MLIEYTLNILIILLIIYISYKLINEFLCHFSNFRIKKKYKNDDSIEEPELPISPMWNVRDFRNRMEGIIIDENTRFSSPPESVDDDESGAEIITAGWEKEYEKRYL